MDYINNIVNIFIYNKLLISFYIVLILVIFFCFIYIYKKKNKSLKKELIKIGTYNFFGPGSVLRATTCYIEQIVYDKDKKIKAFHYINKYLENKSKYKYLLIIGNAGVGKTTLLLNYFLYNQKLPYKRKNNIIICCFGTENVDSFIKKVQDKPDKILFLDALNEDSLAYKDFTKRLYDLLFICQEFKKIIFTCRPDFFNLHVKVSRKMSIIKIGGNKNEFFLQRIYLLDFDEKQVKDYIARYYNQRKIQKKVYNLIENFSDNIKPIFLNYFPLLINNDELILKYNYHFYDMIVNNWVKNNIKNDNKEQDLFDFIETLALNIFSKICKSSCDFVTTDEYLTLAVDKNISIKKMKITHNSLLDYYENGKIKFSHISFMEYLYVIAFLKLPVDKRPKQVWTDQMHSFFNEMYKTGEFDDIDLNGVYFINSINMRFIPVKTGKFLMGSPEEEPQRFQNELLHEVSITKGFYIAETAVTQGQWEELMENNPSSNTETKDLPVENVSFNDVKKFIMRINHLEDTNTYRLPTEAQWEYACRANTTGPFSFGNCLNEDQGNYNREHPLPGCSKGEYRKKTFPVYSLKPNQWGLYNMHGNVWEWCEDWFDKYPSAHVIDPEGPITGALKICRGGSWYNGARYCRSASRGKFKPDHCSDVIGFRLVKKI